MTSLFPASISSCVVGTAGGANSFPEEARSLGLEGRRREGRSKGGRGEGGGGKGSVEDGSELVVEEGVVQIGMERDISEMASEAAERVS